MSEKVIYYDKSFQKENGTLLKKLHNKNISGDYAMKYHLLLPPVLLALCGCHSDLHYQELAVESARKFIYEHARELTPEQFAHVRLTPPVLLTGPILSRNEQNAVKGSLAGGEKIQICITWRIPGQEKDYLVFGMSEPRMAYWRPLKLIRRSLGKFDSNAQSAMSRARKYAISSLYSQLSAADLNTVRFTHPEAVLTSFALAKDAVKKVDKELDDELDDNKNKKKELEKEVSPAPVPWKKIAPVTLNEDTLQISLLWKISGNRYVTFCGLGKEDLSGWKILMAGIMEETEINKVVVKKLRTSDRFLLPVKKASDAAPVSGQKKSESEKNVAGGK